MASRTLASIALTALFTVWQSAPAPAANHLDAIWLSPDVTLALSAVVTNDEDVAVDNLLGLVMLENLGTLPPEAEVDAFHIGPDSNGDRLFSLNVAAELPGPVYADRSDVVRFDGSTYTIEFDASAAGVAAGSNLDAVSRIGTGDLVISFDTTLQLGSVVADDEDLIRVSGGSYSLLFDGSAEGVDTALDLDGAHTIVGGGLLLSFDTSGSVGGIVFDDEDVVELDSGVWSLSYDGSAHHSEWPPGDVQAVPEPGLLAMLAAGIAGLAGLMRLRRGAASSSAR